MRPLRVLIGCATSCVALDAFLARGHDAWQCDLLPADKEFGCLIDGFPKYIVTSFGRVISLHKKKPHELAQHACDKGYQRVNLRHNRSGGVVLVHRLVAQAFIENPGELPCVRHLDGNPANNRAHNLAWGTYAQNEEDKREHGTWDARRVGKLTTCDRYQVRELASEGWSQKALADLFDVSRPTITRLLNGKIWGNDHAN